MKTSIEIVTKKKFGEILRSRIAAARVKYNADWEDAYMFGRTLPTRPNEKVMEATLLLEVGIKG